ncbi:MAG: hypothetical protein U9O83_02180 [Campylobacterota bacterium]|nr:hypothetical protein [Campylobacterota bacterium]
MRTYIFLIITAILLVGCDTQNKTDEETIAMINSTEAYFSLEPSTYDYYEIANDTILHTSINTDMVNITRLTVINEDRQYITEHKEFIDDYNILNKALDINETADVYRENILNTFTNKSIQKVYKYGYGIYEVKTNYCIINSDIQGCNTYVYAIKMY